MAGLFIAIFLMTFAAGRLSEPEGNSLAYFGGAAAVSLLVQAMIVWRHNHQLSRETGHDALRTGTPDPRER
jgi:hypothetical protein